MVILSGMCYNQCCKNMPRENKNQKMKPYAWGGIPHRESEFPLCHRVKLRSSGGRTETSLGIYLLVAAVSFLIAVVVYYNGPEFSTILGYFMLLILVSLFYNYRISLFTAICSIVSYGIIISHLIYKQAISPQGLDLLVELGCFITATLILSWLIYKLQTKPQFLSPFPARDSLRTVLNSITYGVIILDRQNQIILLNEEAEKILGIKEREVRGISITTPSPKPSLQNLYQILTTEKGSLDFSTTTLQIQKPQKGTLQVITTPILQEDKNFGTVKIFQDVTHEEEINKMKSELIALVSHQLRTPLSAVKWSIKMLLDGDLGKITEEQRNILAKGYRSNERMIHLVNDLLNISRIEEGRFQYKFVSASIEDLIESTVQEFSYSLKEKRMALKFEKPPKPFLEVRMDPSKIHVVLQNILNNAVNYTPSGGKIEIQIKPLSKELEISIKDSGMGIPKNQQAKLFTKFFRADNAIRMQTEGSGLGLFIAKNIIERHKGRIWAKSEENEGSTFYFTLPKTLS